MSNSAVLLTLVGICKTWAQRCGVGAQRCEVGAQCCQEAMQRCAKLSRDGAGFARVPLGTLVRDSKANVGFLEFV